MVKLAVITKTIVYLFVNSKSEMQHYYVGMYHMRSSKHPIYRVLQIYEIYVLVISMV